MSAPRKNTSAAPALLRITYASRGGEQRDALIALDAAGVWFVYDVPAAPGAAQTGFLVERLDGAGEELREAAALAADYVACQLAYARGERREHTVEDPLPGAREHAQRLSKIRRDAQRAAIAAASDPTSPLEPDWLQRLVRAPMAPHPADREGAIAA